MRRTQVCRQSRFTPSDQQCAPLFQLLETDSLSVWDDASPLKVATQESLLRWRLCLAGTSRFQTAFTCRSASRTKRRNTDGPRRDGPCRDSSVVLMCVAVERQDCQAANVKSEWSDCHRKNYFPLSLFLSVFLAKQCDVGRKRRTGHSGLNHSLFNGNHNSLWSSNVFHINSVGADCGSSVPNAL